MVICLNSSQLFVASLFTKIQLFLCEEWDVKKMWSKDNRDMFDWILFSLMRKCQLNQRVVYQHYTTFRSVCLLSSVSDTEFFLLSMVPQRTLVVTNLEILFVVSCLSTTNAIGLWIKGPNEPNLNDHCEFIFGLWWLDSTKFYEHLWINFDQVNNFWQRWTYLIY